MRILLPVLSVLLAGALVLLGPPAAAQTPPPSLEDDLAEIDRLLSEYQYEAAVELAQRLRQESGTRAALEKVALDLLYVETLAEYLDSYSWEIAQRERVDTGGGFRTWTTGQITGEIHRVYFEIWQERDDWGTELPGVLAEHFEENGPPRIRGTLRDAFTYSWAELLADTLWWTPRQENEVFRLDSTALILGDPEASRAVALAEAAVHPLVKLGAVLDDLEDWHRRAGRGEAALETRLVRFGYLSDSLDHEEERELLLRNLAEHVDRLGPQYEHWSQGMAVRAEELFYYGDAPDARIEARRLALQGAEAHPDSAGGQSCRRLVEIVERPGFSLQAMASDGPGKRSLLVSHVNLPEIHFRAYRLDDVEQATFSYGSIGEPPQIGDRKPDAEWTVALPPTADYRLHDTYVVPPLSDPGTYVVVASRRSDFREEDNQRIATQITIGDLVLLTRMELPQRVTVTTLSGSSGRALPGARVRLYSDDGEQRRFRLVHETLSDENGDVELSENLVWGRNLITARHGDSVIFGPDFYRSSEIRYGGTESLVYTDRSIYRPGQKVLWKVVAYRYDREGTGVRYEVLPKTPVEVTLEDPHGEVVASADAVTNDFGSASGELSIPDGRLLGDWTLRASPGGTAYVRVEEYKRPTFEVSVGDPAEPLRLNRSVTLGGEVRYYFGLPVTGGTVDWRIERRPVYPSWWEGWFEDEPGETIDSGTTRLDAEGRFEVTFTPWADERLAAEAAEKGRNPEDVTYRYALRVDVTDEGGETRSASRTFRLGFVAVDARIEGDAGFFRSGSPVRFVVHRTDLDGVPLPGQGEWEMVRLAQPETALLPADQPRDRDGEPAPYETPGDRLRPRWDREYSPEAVLRRWDDGGVVSRGRLDHDESGEAAVELAELPAGAYRLRYTTRDAFGAVCERSRELLVAPRNGEDVVTDPLALPAVLLVERPSVAVGENARLFVHSGLAGQELTLYVEHGWNGTERRRLRFDRGPQVIEIPIRARDRGGLGVSLVGVRDHQLFELTGNVFVPWDDRKLSIDFATFRDRLRPGTRETWTLRVRGDDEAVLQAGTAELLAYMYDRSLDLFAPHRPEDPLDLYPTLTDALPTWSNLQRSGEPWPWNGEALPPVYLEVQAAITVATGESPAEEAAPGKGLRSDFSETAFWEPHLLAGDDGTVTLEFTVPDSLTEWNVWVHALTRDLRSGRLTRTARSAKELMVRPYVPRFLREGDRADFKVVVNWAEESATSGTLDFEIFDPETEESLLADFGLTAEETTAVPFTVEAGGGVALDFPLQVPARVGTVAFKAVARTPFGSDLLSDGELRPLPVLPGRMHLLQSRFATLHDEDRRVLRFADLEADDDPSRIDEQLVVTLDAQLFYSVLNALPYLVSYPYECTEQTLNRFVSTGILSSLYDDDPAVSRMATALKERETRLERWDANDPNRKMLLAETPWLVESRGGDEPPADLIHVLDPRIAASHRASALAKLREAQDHVGGFPWWPGGPSSPYMTLYLLHGFSRAVEFGVDVPKDMVVSAWIFLREHYLNEITRRMDEDKCCWELVTFLNFVLASFPDASWTDDVFSAEDRARMLDFSLRHWRRHSPLLKSYLALTLKRAGRGDDARLVFDSVMESARTTEDQGTFWAPEERSWLWYNDTVETHAFVLRTLLELMPDDPRRHGLVQWLFLNKKLNHWKSTRATAEVIYALVHYLKQEGTLAARENATVTFGPMVKTFDFDPDRYTGQKNQVVIAGDDVDPATLSSVVVEKTSPGFLFASATWHFSTERLPEEGSGDFYSVTRQYYRRELRGDEWVLEPLNDGTALVLGDQVEVHLSLRAKHASEYVHLRDPRGAGFEPESTTSRFKWDLGLGYYEEIRDSGTSFFFEWLPAGEYTFRYRLRATTSGVFRVGPATIQSMYAPEFAAYSAGTKLWVGE